MAARPVGGTGIAAGSFAQVIDEVHSDIWAFDAEFLLPRRAFMTAVPVQVLPRFDEKNVGAVVWGYSPTPYGTFAAVGPPELAMYFGSQTLKIPKYSSRRQVYQIDASLLPGQSGSPIGYEVDGNYTVFGVITNRSSEACNKVVGHFQDIDNEISRKAGVPEDQIDKNSVTREDALVRQFLDPKDKTSYFVPIVRSPGALSDIYLKQVTDGGIPPKVLKRLEARLDAARLMYEDMAKTTDNISNMRQGLEQLVQGLTPMQRAYLLQQIRKELILDEHKSQDLQVIILGCDHIEPAEK